MQNPPSFELAAYAANYAPSVNAQLQRVLFVAETCPPVRTEALLIARDLIRSQQPVGSCQVSLMRDLMTRLTSVPSYTTQLAEQDHAWIYARQELQQKRTEQLEQELRLYKANMIKESIRMGYSDMGDHLRACGDLEGALRAHSKSRDCASNLSHALDSCVKILQVCVEMQNWSQVQSLATKLNSTQDKDEKVVTEKISKTATALHALALGRFDDCARALRSIPQGKAGDPCVETMSSNDIAIYMVVSLLQSFNSRGQLKEVLNNRHYLELEPNYRELVELLLNTKYSQFFALLGRLQNDWICDMYLSRHVETLVTSITDNVLLQFYKPYNRVALNRAAEELGMQYDELFTRTVNLTLKGRLEARIDSQTRILFSVETNDQEQVYQSTIKTLDSYVENMSTALFHASLARAGISVSGPQSRQPPQFPYIG